MILFAGWLCGKRADSTGDAGERRRGTSRSCSILLMKVASLKGKDEQVGGHQRQLRPAERMAFADLDLLLHPTYVFSGDNNLAACPPQFPPKRENDNQEEVFIRSIQIGIGLQ